MEKENKMKEPQKEKVKDFDIMLEEVLADLIKNNVSAELKKEIKIEKKNGPDDGDWL